MSPRRITPFRRGTMQWARVPRIGGVAVQRSLGVSDDTEAKEVCRFLEWLRGRGVRSAYLLDKIATGAVSVLVAYAAYIENRLDAYEQELRVGIADPDLEPWVGPWEKEMIRRRRPNDVTRAKYVRQVRTLIVKGQRFPRSHFTKQRIREWLASLEVGQPNRYRAALSSFAEYLVFEDVLPVNVVRQVPQAKEAEPRTTHLTPEDAERLVAALPQPYRPLHALMIGTGMELGAALKLTRSDVTLQQVRARGTKRATRDRTCTIYHRWALFVFRHVAEFLDAGHFTPNAPLFPGMKPWAAYRVMKQALATPALHDLPQDYRVHDHRHTWAVAAVRDGLALHTIAHQLGHRDATMVVKVYGRFRPVASDFDRNVTTTATPPANARADGPVRIQR